MNGRHLCLEKKDLVQVLLRFQMKNEKSNSAPKASAAPVEKKPTETEKKMTPTAKEMSSVTGALRKLQHPIEVNH